MNSEIEGTFHLSRKDVTELVNSAIDHAVLGLKYWVILGILLNGVPTLLIGGAFYYQLTETIAIAKENKAIIIERKAFMNEKSTEIRDMQDFLKEFHGFVPREKVTDKYR